ncbi:MAG: trehalose-6-phosphate synthase [Chloroflexi bacterium]|nr:trehalose-6-phosphate synthase [Chloroflexota bacterium]
MMTTPSLASQRSSRLLELLSAVLHQRRLIVVSNRGPLEYHMGPDGRMEPRRGSGAVVTALSPLVRAYPFSWVASAMGEGDRKAAEDAAGQHIASPVPGQQVVVRFVVTPRRVYHKFYNIFCNPLLWFLQHYMWSAPYTPNVDATVYDAWEGGYVPVNRAFADGVLAEARDMGQQAPVVIVHDYHLYLVPAMVRQEVPEAVILHYVHIPWPSARMWQLLPTTLRAAIFQGLCACDVVGFQSQWDVFNFLDGVRAFVPGAQVDFNGRAIELQGRRTVVRAYPLAIDVAEVRRIAESPRAQEYTKKLAPLCAEKTIVRVDRAEPNKNIVRGFKAYHLMLERRPELRGKVKFLAFLVESRTHIKQYERYLEEINEAVRALNQAFGSEGWQPVQVFYENNYTQAVAAMRLYDVLLINPVSDGMNLVAKEGPVVNKRNGVLVLSETAGAYDQLRDAALCTSPADLEGTAEALYRALTMSEDERAARASRLVEAIEREDSLDWLHRQLQDLGPFVKV